MLEIDLFNSGSYARVAEKLICRVPIIYPPGTNFSTNRFNSPAVVCPATTS
jgi:hypothetical protein